MKPLATILVLCAAVGAAHANPAEAPPAATAQSAAVDAYLGFRAAVELTRAAVGEIAPTEVDGLLKAEAQRVTAAGLRDEDWAAAGETLKQSAAHLVTSIKAQAADVPQWPADQPADVYAVSSVFLLDHALGELDTAIAVREDPIFALARIDRVWGWVGGLTGDLPPDYDHFGKRDALAQAAMDAVAIEPPERP